ncbi:MAG: nickel-dependent lactate racemase [Bacillota bacterium]|uniref:Nickel-dependent lactate racemase n=1 Tax=Thermanaerosceptrum fracticalcis TaxID=1712410 RepID=A0A7G6E2E7_THEFR|nr:nickel-dependent lactate racemase [Thermanaerosceptrum fracticalcis]QNB46251.1 nickel-dependent lactate racemase [Thermanaerosceptrum fracticalcis]
MSEVTNIKLKYGNDYHTVSVPTKNIMDIIIPEDLPGVPDQMEEVRRALREPIESEPLSVLAKGKENVVILCSDITRPSPSYLLVPPILEELNTAGVTDDKITVVFGLGYHRPHTEEEKKKLIGEEVYRRVKCIDHDRNNCVYLGQSSRGTPIWVFEPVAKTDLIIGTANLEFHYKAGYSGGDKALMPGVCSKETIQANHVMMIRPGTMPGKADGNPMREDIEEIGRIAGVKFIVNPVLNSNKEIVKCVAGHPVKAHREGCKYIDMMYKRSIPEKADIVICCPGGHPKDINLYQAQKGFENASYAVKDGGIIILFAKCGEMLGEKTFEDWMFRATSVDDPVNWIQEEFVLGAHKAVVICLVLQKKKAYLISDIPDDITRKCFFEPAKSVEEALEKALAKMGPEAKILVMPYANSTLPFVEE